MTISEDIRIRNSEIRLEPLLLAALLGGLLLTRTYGHLLFHSAVELFTVAVSWSVFFLAWNARRFLDNGYILFLGIAFLFVGIIDTGHALAYKGMGVLPGDGADLATQLWIAGRFLESASFLLAPVFLRRTLNVKAAMGAYAAALVLLWAALYTGVFPACFVEGAGLTQFKVASEYAVIAILLVSFAALYRTRKAFDRPVLIQMATTIVLTVGAELAFTLYTDVYGISNVVGHLLRFAAVWFLYRAIIVMGLVKPHGLLFRNLAQSEEALRRSDERYRAFVANSSEGICRLETKCPVPVALPEEDQVRLLVEHAYVAECNDAYARIHGRERASDMMGAPLSDMLPRDPDGTGLIRAFVRAGYRLAEAEACTTAPNGSPRHTAHSFTGVVENGAIVRAWGVIRDVTERTRYALERERLIADLQQALAEVKTLSGLLPICAKCKKIRDDKGYWTRVESYLEQRVQVSFSHSICPECLVALYPGYAPEITEE